MKIPNEIRINGVEFSVGYAPNLRMNDKLCFGYIDFNNSKIMLSETDGTEHQQRCITFLHEVIHGIIKNSAVEVFDEEPVVDMLSRGIYQVLQDNGERLFDLKEGKKK